MIRVSYYFCVCLVHCFTYSAVRQHYYKVANIKLHIHTVLHVVLLPLTCPFNVLRIADADPPPPYASPSSPRSQRPRIQPLLPVPVTDADAITASPPPSPANCSKFSVLNASLHMHASILFGIL